MNATLNVPDCLNECYSILYRSINMNQLIEFYLRIMEDTQILKCLCDDRFEIQVLFYKGVFVRMLKKQTAKRCSSCYNIR